jgi:hypothetical protein
VDNDPARRHGRRRRRIETSRQRELVGRLETAALFAYAVFVDDESPSDPLADALLALLIRKRILSVDDAEELAELLEEDGEEKAAHLARCAAFRAFERPQSEYDAERARARFHVVAPDGGKAKE